MKFMHSRYLENFNSIHTVLLYLDQFQFINNIHSSLQNLLDNLANMFFLIHIVYAVRFHNDN